MKEIYELGIEQFTRIVVNKVEELGYNIVLQNPQEDEDFPCGVVSNVYKNILIAENETPVKSSFYVSVEWWSDKTYNSMMLFDKATIKLRELNLTLVGNPHQSYDEITKKYRYGGNYEVIYNGITNSFQNIK